MIDFNNIRLTEIIKETISKLINEELGISDEVYKVSCGIVDVIENQWKSMPKESSEYNIWKRSGEFEFDIFGDVYTISYTVWNYKDYDHYKSTTNKPVLLCSTNQKNKMIHLSVLAISGEIQDNTCADSIQHEVEHIYQSKMQGGELFPDKDGVENIYKMAEKSISDNRHNGWISKLASVIYYSRNEELDAFVNGLYATLAKSGWMYGEDEIVKNSNPYKIIGFMSSMKEEMIVNFNDDDFIQSAKFFNKKRKWFIAMAQKSIKDCTSKMAKVIKKARKEGLTVNEGVIWHRTLTTSEPLLKKKEKPNKK